MADVLNYRVVRRKGQKHLYLRIAPGGEVTVSAPAFVSDETIEAFVASKSGWLRRHLDRMKSYAKYDPERWTPGCRAWLLGERLLITLKPSRRHTLQKECGALLFYGQDPDRLKEALRRFYRKEAARYLPSRLAYWSERTGLFPDEVAFRFYKRRWGSCDRKGRIVFNPLLMRYEREVIDYVIVHELAHLRYFHHKKPFWEFVGRYVPDYRTLRERLL